MLSDLAINLAAAAIGAVLFWSWKAHFLPILRGRLRRLPKLNGTKWRRVGDSGDNESIFTIRQSGTRIWATITRNEQRQRTYDYVGQISGHQIVLTWEDTDSPEQMIGAMVLYLSVNLTKLTGHSVYYKYDRAKVVAIERTYTRML